MTTRSAVLSSYRALLRARRVAFAGDAHALQGASLWVWVRGCVGGVCLG
jgi:hypothetical protein